MEILKEIEKLLKKKQTTKIMKKLEEMSVDNLAK